ncbi:MAG: hypothetical protein HQL50_04280 [Magnetococcales bacterium]|nr:hypothetical protein [Magnetococcales bacterium]
MSRLGTLFITLLALMGSAALMAGCSPYPHAQEGTHPLISQPETQRPKRSITLAAYNAAEALVINLGDRLPKRHKILPTSFVNSDKLSETSPLGRHLASLIGSRLSQYGYSLLEIKLRKNVFVKEGEGEFILSRDQTKINTTYKVRAIMVGSYTVSRTRVDVSVKLVRAKDQVVMTAYDFSLPKDGDIQALLGESNS